MASPSLRRRRRAQIKLDTIASDLVESVEINKTLQANIDADGIGGSVNLRTKTAGEQPTFNLYGLGGYTPIISGRDVYMVGGTLGERFGQDKASASSSAGPTTTTAAASMTSSPARRFRGGSVPPHYDSMDMRDYEYYRTRYGFAGQHGLQAARRLQRLLRGLYSTFRNWARSGSSR